MICGRVRKRSKPALSARCPARILCRSLWRRPGDGKSAVVGHSAGVRRGLPLGRYVELHQGAAISESVIDNDRVAGYFRAPARLRFSAIPSTTDHISPIGGIKGTSPAGLYLRGLGIAQPDFNNYGARRLNHEVMIRGAFSNSQLKNFMMPGIEGGITVHHPEGSQQSIYDAAMRYIGAKACHADRYCGRGIRHRQLGAGDWAAKAPRLLGVRAVVAGSFENVFTAATWSGWGCCPVSSCLARMPRPTHWMALNYSIWSDWTKTSSRGRASRSWCTARMVKSEEICADPAAGYADGSRLRSPRRPDALHSPVS